MFSSSQTHKLAKLHVARESAHDNVIKWKHFPRYGPIVTGEFPAQRATDAELWCFLWPKPAPTVRQTMERPVIWDAIALIIPDCKVHEANMGPTWVLPSPGGPHVGPMNLAIRDDQPLHWRHNDHDSISNHQPHGCLLNRLFRRRPTKTSKFRVTGLCVGNSPGPVYSPHKGPVTRKMFPFDDVIMNVTTHSYLRLQVSDVPSDW